jgi:uroporphyrinogen decarboxylase
MQGTESYDRIMTVLRGGIPDRVPMYELTINPGVIHGLEPGMDYFDFVEHAGYDAVGPNATWDSLGRVRWIDEPKRVFIDRWGVVRRLMEDVIPVPIEGPIKSAADLAAFRPPRPEEDPILERAEKLVARFKGRKATFVLGRDVWTGCYMLRGMENLLVDMLTDPPLVQDLVRMQVEYYLKVHALLLGIGIDIIHLVDDYAYGSGPFVSPELFERFLFPGLKEVVGDVKKRGGWCLKHTDGDIRKIIGLIVASGIDGLGPLEPEGHMVLSEVKRDFPSITVMGNVSCDLLGRGSPEEVAESVRSLIAETAAGGRYILSSGNSIAFSTKPENLASMLEAARRYGRYDAGAQRPASAAARAQNRA